MNQEMLCALSSAYAPQWIALRRRLHACPEAGNAEFSTRQIVKQALLSYGAAVSDCAGTGLVGVLHGAGAGRCVAFRAELDALCVPEKTGLSFASQNEGFMHACGHDVHMAGVLGAAQLLSLTRDSWNGTVKFLFQPDEEGEGGAERMIAEGCLEAPHVDAVFGMHVLPEYPADCVAFRFGASFAASDTFEIHVRGKSCHGAQPQKGIDALLAAARIALACTDIPNTLAEDERAVVSFGVLRAGTVSNVIADEAVLHGIIRTLGIPLREKVRALVRQTAQKAAQQNGAQIQIVMRESYPGVTNEDDMTRLALASAQSLGLKTQLLPEPMMMTEDFGCFLLERPGCFYHVGAQSEFPLHSGQFAPKEDAVANAALLHARIALDFLANEKE